MYCQKCRTPLRLDDFLDSLNPASFKILVDSAPDLKPESPSSPRTNAATQRREHYNEVSQNAGPPQNKRVIPPPLKTGRPSNPAMSFVMLSESQISHSPHEDQKTTGVAGGSKGAAAKSDSDQDGKLSERMERSLRLFEILSARSDIDHPICSECTDLLMQGLQQQQTTVSRERDAYISFLKQAQQNIPTEEEQRQVREALTAAEKEQEAALEELEKLEAEKAAVEEEIAALDRESAELEADEEAFFRERNEFEMNVARLRDERDSLHSQLANDTKLLQQLQRTNVYNDAFCIGHDGNFGTINGLRLGRLPDHPVEWAEINAAWGQAALLLTVVAEKFNYKLQGYKLIPMGSTSKIEKIESPASSQQSQNRSVKPKVQQLELFCTGDLPLGLGFLHRGFDNAMVCFLDILKQLGQHVERSSANGTSKMPYVINKDKINDYSIKLGTFNQEESWTSACKYTLTCCKFLLARASQVDEISDNAKPKR